MTFRRVHRFRFHRPSRRIMRINLAVAGGVLCLVVAVSFYVSATPIAHPNASPSPVQTRDLNLLSTAEQLLIRACMHESGFSYWLIPPVPPSQISPIQPYPLVMTSIHWARVNGLGGIPVFNSAANQRYYDHLSASRQNVYPNALLGKSGGPAVQVALPSGGIEGAGSQGCQARAESELYGNYRAWFQASTVAMDLPVLWEPMVLGDTRYLKAVAWWSDCMRARGYRYSSPEQAATAFERPASSRPSRAEVAVAVAEAMCANQTPLAGVTSVLTKEFSAKADGKYQSSLNTEWRLERNALPRARRLLGSISRQQQRS
jgi:hypothetical protein